MSSLKVAAILLVLAGGAFWILMVNPLNWGVTASSSFSVSKFRAIRQGDSISSVVEKLGQPVGVGDWTPCQTPPCKNFVFAEEPVAWWVVGYAKAWVIVGPSQNVVETIWYEEP